MDGWKDWFDWVDLGGWFESFFDWIRMTFRVVWDFINTLLLTMYDGVEFILNGLPSIVVIAVLAGLAWLAGAWRLALLSALSLVLIDLMDQWQNAMQTLSLVAVAVLVCVVLSIPIGIAAARSNVVSTAVKPVLDLMQTMPALVYLIPAVLMFQLGPVPGIVATIIFAMPPGIRLTELGIRQVDQEVVEAGHAFGSPPNAILRQIQLPLALPSIMAGINQVIMLSLSMTVLAGFVGGPGLGQQVLRALSRFDIGLGFEAGLSVVILAIYLDRVTAALGSRTAVARLAEAA
ncbi:MAG TPA: ABC transporter permease subunit [Jiangellaceae bacterium]